MTDNGNFNAPSEVVATPTTSPTPSQPSALYRIFIGPNGLRAGWRFVLYILLVAALSYAALFIRRQFFPRPHFVPGALFPPGLVLISKLIEFAIVVIAALIMASIEGEKWDHFGLPLKQAFKTRFWFGMLWGFTGVSLIMLALYLAGTYRIESLAIRGGDIAKYAIVWGAVFLLVGLGEEFSLRGYTQYTLASGIGFWPATIVMSAMFLGLHVRNSGETWIGLTDVFLFGLFSSFTLWRTGDLWFAVGIHTAWDWGLTYFYSVPDSGLMGQGHLLNGTVSGPAWLSGGSAGPEGSALNIAFWLLWFVIVALIYPRRQWVGMEDHRRAMQGTDTAAKPKVLIDTSALSS